MISYASSAPTTSLYIHWPFCPYKCSFCPFVAFSGRDPMMQPYHEALCAEMDIFFKDLPKERISTVFLGGGTPSTYPDNLLLDMFGTLRRWTTVDATTEVTIEVNPGTVRPEQLYVWRECGINRLSIGVQSLNDAVLKKLNRLQSAADVHRTIELATQLFDNISVDLIVGLPGVSPAEWQDLLRTLVTWPIKHISIYLLTIHENTPLYFSVAKDAVQLPPEEHVLEQFNWSHQFLVEQGFVHYEVSNYARPGFESRHNQVYWNHTPYKGFGVGACSFDGKRRFQNEKNLSRYVDVARDTAALSCFMEELTPQQQRLEALMLGMRQLNKGVPVDLLFDGASVDEQVNIQQKVDGLVAGGFVAVRNGRIFLLPAGLSIENEIIVALSR